MSRPPFPSLSLSLSLPPSVARRQRRMTQRQEASTATQPARVACVGEMPTAAAAAATALLLVGRSLDLPQNATFYVPLMAPLSSFPPPLPPTSALMIPPPAAPSIQFPPSEDHDATGGRGRARRRTHPRLITSKMNETVDEQCEWDI